MDEIGGFFEDLGKGIAGFCEDLWKSVKPYASTIASIAVGFIPGLQGIGLMLVQALVSSAIGTVTSGGDFGDFAAGFGMSLAMGYALSSVGNGIQKATGGTLNADGVLEGGFDPFTVGHDTLGGNPLGEVVGNALDNMKNSAISGGIQGHSPTAQGMALAAGSSVANDVAGSIAIPSKQYTAESPQQWSKYDMGWFSAEDLFNPKFLPKPQSDTIRQYGKYGYYDSNGKYFMTTWAYAQREGAITLSDALSDEVSPGMIKASEAEHLILTVDEVDALLKLGGVEPAYIIDIKETFDEMYSVKLRYQEKYPGADERELLHIYKARQDFKKARFAAIRLTDPKMDVYSTVVGPTAELIILAGEIPLIVASGFRPKNLTVPGRSAISPKEVGKPGIGFKSFNEFKNAMGPAGKGNAWHHIVEQTPSNLSRFGAEAIHNTDNLVRLPNGKGTIHAKISGYYSSKQVFTGGKTVRQWLSTQSFEQQMEFGNKTIKMFGR